jgi:hypothetical protein
VHSVGAELPSPVNQNGMSGGEQPTLLNCSLFT